MRQQPSDLDIITAIHHELRQDPDGIGTPTEPAPKCLLPFRTDLPDDARIPLTPEPVDSDLSTILKRRQSATDFTGPIPLDDIAAPAQLRQPPHHPRLRLPELPATASPLCRRTLTHQRVPPEPGSH